MNRLRRYAMIVATLVVAALLLAVGATLFLQGEFSKIERKEMSQDVARIVNAVNNRADGLNTQANDWAYWDDTYKFVSDANREYIDSNLTASTLQNLRINFMLFFNKQGKLVHGTGVDITTGKIIPIPERLLAELKSDKSLLATSDTSSHQGFLNVGEDPLLFVTKPVLDSNSSGPYNGTVVFAEYITPANIQKLANLNDLTLSYQLIGSSDMTADTQALLPQISSTSATVKPLSGNKIAGYQIMKDVHGKQLFVARVEQKRDVYLESRRALIYYLIASIAVVALATVMAIYSTREAITKDKIIQIKDEFFSMASHELRTPLTAIRGNSQMLQQFYGDKNDEDFSRLTTDIHTSSERLIRLVNNFLDLARLEQNRIPLTITQFSLSEAFRPIVDELQTIAKDKNVALRLNLPSGLPQVSADEDRVKQIVYNLAGNSLKFTDAGSVTVSAKPEGNAIKVYVADTGRGITPQDQQRLFRKFQQAKDSDAQKGSGLGLYISKVMVEKMGGTIRLESSAPGKGSVISFTLPAAHAS